MSVRHGKNGGVKVLKQNIIFENSLKPIDKIVYIFLGMKNNWGTVKGLTLNELCEQLNVSERTLIRSIKFLEGEGFLKKDIVRNDKGQIISNTYEILK